ncbi:interferon gamma receptor 2 [Mugil cephalus]|uniref:interferon gamma receptor 2 n=1 Tax=Mugil cephalus TaxID=48193 RepID=UPI001FB78125|nr:interferon gamma receptor 2 [Mugil cephalus]
MSPGTRRSSRNDAVAMLFVLLCYQAVVQVLSKERPPPPPQNVYVDQWEMKWTPATEERNITYTVQYCSSDTICTEWKDVPACTQISSSFCNVTLLKAEAERACVRLRVQADRRGSFSKPVNACSMNSDSCTPWFNLTTRPNSLTVHLSKDHRLAEKHAARAKHRVYFGKEGDTPEGHMTTSSCSFDNLKGGQRYCVSVEYVYDDNPVGMPSCIQCEVIPSSRDAKTPVIIVVVMVFSVIVIVASAYIYLFKRKKIKEWLQPPYEMPDMLLDPLPERHIFVLPTGNNEENYDVLSSITLNRSN